MRKNLSSRRGSVLYICTAGRGRRKEPNRLIIYGLVCAVAGSVARASHTIKSSQFPPHRSSFSCSSSSWLLPSQWDEFGKQPRELLIVSDCFDALASTESSKMKKQGSHLISNDGAQGLRNTLTHTHTLTRTHIFGQKIKVAQCAVQPLHPPQRLCLIHWASGWRSPKTFDRSGKHCVYRFHVLKGLLEIWHSAFLSLGDKWQTPRGCCSDCRTNWPSSRCIYSASQPQPVPTSYDGGRHAETHLSVPAELSPGGAFEKHTGAYRCSVQTSYL